MAYTTESSVLHEQIPKFNIRLKNIHFQIIIKVPYFGKGSEILIEMGIKLVWDSLGIKMLIDRTTKLPINSIREINKSIFTE